MTETQFLTQISSICRSCGAERVVLFGSRASGRNRPNSDFDVAVYGDCDVYEVRERLDDLDTLFSADVVDMNRCSNRALIEEIEEHGIPI